MECCPGHAASHSNGARVWTPGPSTSCGSRPRTLRSTNLHEPRPLLQRNKLELARRDHHPSPTNHPTDTHCSAAPSCNSRRCRSHAGYSCSVTCPFGGVLGTGVVTTPQSEEPDHVAARCRLCCAVAPTAQNPPSLSHFALRRQASAVRAACGNAASSRWNCQNP